MSELVHGQDPDDIKLKMNHDGGAVPYRFTPCGEDITAAPTTMSDDWDAVTCPKCKRKKPKAVAE